MFNETKIPSVDEMTIRQFVNKMTDEGLTSAPFPFEDDNGDRFWVIVRLDYNREVDDI